MNIKKLFKSNLLLMAVMMYANASFAALAIDNAWDDDGTIQISWNNTTLQIKQGALPLLSASTGPKVSLIPLIADAKAPQAVTNCQLDEANGNCRLLMTLDKIPAAACTLTIQNNGVIRFDGSHAIQGIQFQASINTAVLPGIRLEDVVYRPAAFTDTPTITIPDENWFIGLTDQGNGMLALAWLNAINSLSLQSGADTFTAITCMTGNTPIYFELMAAEQLWYQEKLTMKFLEKDVILDWQRPFKARYKSQFQMRAGNTTVRSFYSRIKPSSQFRPEVGGFQHPLRFQRNQAIIHLSKKILPRGTATLYPWDETDYSALEFLKRTPVAKTILPRNARAPLPKGPKGASNPGYVACGGTAIQRNTICDFGLLNREKEFLTDYADFLSDYVHIVQQKNANYRTFIDAALAQLKNWQNNLPADQKALREYLKSMNTHADYVDEGWKQKITDYRKDSPEAYGEYATQLAERMKEILNTPGKELSPELDSILKKMNYFSWAHDESMGMRFSMSTRAWAQDAAFQCASLPEATPYAKQIRAEIRNALNGAPDW